MNKTLRSIVATAEIIAGAVGLAGCAKSDAEKYPLQGELVLDYIQDKGTDWESYRIFVRVGDDIVTYPIIGNSSELEKLQKELVSRQESGTRGEGDKVGISLEKGILSLDLINGTYEAILFPKSVKKLSRGGSEV